MADTVSKERRSWNMSRIQGKDTAIEVKVRKYLFHHGFRYRKNVRQLPGTPDIVLRKYNTAIFVHGCFWHQHPFCRYASTPKSNTEYWDKKLSHNVEKDKSQISKLESLGWHVIVIWECELKKENFEITMQRVINELEETYVSQRSRELHHADR